ncbi:MAG: hypothetical protein OXU19_09490 [bacterium]|nr:hypothetical protein [bacterium]
MVVMVRGSEERTSSPLLTRLAEEKGVFKDASRIGFQDGRNELLASKGLYLRGHRLVSKDISLLKSGEIENPETVELLKCS